MRPPIWTHVVPAMWAQGKVRQWSLITLPVAAIEILVIRIEALQAPFPIGLVWRRLWPQMAGHLLADVMGIVLPVTGLLMILVLTRDLMGMRRVLFGAYPVSMWQLTLLQGAVFGGWAIGMVALADLIPWLTGWSVAPWTAVVMVVPPMLALAGLAMVVSEAARHPWAGFAAALSWALGSFAVMEYAPQIPTPLEILFAATAYSNSARLQINLGVTAATGVALWVAAAAVRYHGHVRGRDA